MVRDGCLYQYPSLYIGLCSQLSMYINDNEGNQKMMNIKLKHHITNCHKETCTTFFLLAHPSSSVLSTDFSTSAQCQEPTETCLQLRMVRAVPSTISMYSRSAGGRVSWEMRRQNQIMMATMVGKKMVLSDTHTLVKPPFWWMNCKEEGNEG